MRSLDLQHLARLWPGFLLVEKIVEKHRAVAKFAGSDCGAGLDCQ
jgi:hypothetical protein